MIAMPDGVKFIIGKLGEGGFEGCAVGGCIRDTLLGRPPGDWDVATDACPADVIKLFRKARVTVIPTGVRHGTVTVVRDGRNYEITSYRIDGEYTDGRRPDGVTFTPDLALDLARRDFTINAMAYNETRGLVDLFGGQADLAAKVIRCVGSAEERLAEDYLRMLRAYRFAAALGFAIDGDIITAAEKYKEKLSGISAERIRAELDKTLANGRYDGICAFLDAFAQIILPETGGALNMIKKTLRFTEPDLVLCLAALLLPTGAEGAKNALKRLKYDNETIKKVTELIAFANSDIISGKPAAKRAMRAVGAEAFPRLGRLQSAISAARAELLAEEIIANGEPFTLKHLKITGDDIMRLTGKPPGEWLGRELERLLEVVTEDPAVNEFQRLRELVMEMHGEGAK